MTIPDSADVELYLGAVIEHASERDVLKLLVDHLSGMDRWSIILANINVGGRQIDFVVATELVTLVIEAKSFSRVVRGGVNGVWEMRVCGDAWVRVGNPYIQVLDQKNALRDRMRLVDADIAGYPDACVAITPRLPSGSDVPASDYKVGIVDIEGIPDLLNKASDLRWSRDKWRELAANLHLEQVQNLDAAFSPKLRQYENLLSAYASAFYRTYASDLILFQQDTYLVESNDRDVQFIVDQVASQGVDLLIRGPSGCGKTLLAKQLAISCMQSGDVPVFIPGKYFAGRLRECIDREVALLDVPSVAKFLSAVRSLEKRLLLIVDGYNECHANEQLALTRSLAAMVRRYGAQLIVSSQGEMVRQDLVETLQVLVREPSMGLKTAISNASAGRPSDKLEYLLGTVTNGLEADMVGRVGSMLPEGSSRFALFDAYARQKFGALASDGIRFMAALAFQLTERLSFSMSVRELDRLAAIEGIHGATLNDIVASGLLMKRADRVSFCHELIFSAFSAEAVVRESAGDVGKILIALAAPKYHASRALIVGATDDENLAIRVLEKTADADLLRAALEGECGAAAQRWATDRCGQVVEKMTLEAANLRFSFREDSWAGAGICSSSLAEWSPSEYALLGAVADNIWRGFHLQSILHAVGVLDKSLSRGHAALKDEAIGKKVALRSALFSDAYVISQHRSALSTLIANIGSGRLFSRNDDREVVDDLKRAWALPRTTGQTYLLLSLSRMLEERDFVLPYILPLLGEQWKFQPYHLQLDLLSFVHFIRVSSDSMRSRLVETLQMLLPKVGPMLSGLVFEALDNLGALEQEATQHAGFVRTEVQAVLSSEMSRETCAQAWGIYVCQFDHPFSSAYGEAMQELSPEETKKILTMACQGAEDAGLFLAPLIQELATYQDPATAPAIERWAKLPIAESVMPQEAVTVFVVAHMALGRLAAKLPSDRGDVDDPARAAMLACGDLYYWSNRPDLSAIEVDAACISAFDVLLRHERAVSATALHMVTRDSSYENGDRWAIVNRFPLYMLTICREGLHRPSEQTGYLPEFIYRQADTLRFAIDVVAEFGHEADLLLLRGLSERQDIGVSALKAIQKIDERVSR